MVPRERAGRAQSAQRDAERAGEEEIMRVEVSPEAAGLIRQQGGRVWVWAARPAMCCGGTPAYMHAATEQPPGLSGFTLVSRREVAIWFRAPAGRLPELLEIGVRGRRRPRVEAYWDGCLIML
jgi:hypothetical protein